MIVSLRHDGLALASDNYFSELSLDSLGILEMRSAGFGTSANDFCFAGFGTLESSKGLG